MENVYLFLFGKEFLPKTTDWAKDKSSLAVDFGGWRICPHTSLLLTPDSTEQKCGCPAPPTRCPVCCSVHLCHSHGTAFMDGCLFIEWVVAFGAAKKWQSFLGGVKPSYPFSPMDADLKLWGRGVIIPWGGHISYSTDSTTGCSFWLPADGLIIWEHCSPFGKKMYS